MSPELCCDDNQLQKEDGRGFSMGHEFVCDLSNLRVTLLDPKSYKPKGIFQKGTSGPKYNPVKDVQAHAKPTISKSKVTLQKPVAKKTTSIHSTIKKK
jgi:hypothetical protein